MSNFVTLEGRALAQAMKIANSVIERRNTIPILSHVKVTLTSDGLEIVGTDLDIFVTQWLDVIDGAGNWSTCIPASVLFAIAGAAGAATVRIEPNIEFNENIYEQAKITIGEADAFYDLQSLPASDFPDPTGGGRSDLIDTFTNGMFAATLAKVKACISTEETRYYLNGVCWDIKEKERRFVATDGHRLAACRYSKDTIKEPVKRIIPRKTVDLIGKHLTGKDVKIFDTKGGLSIEIVSPGVTFRTKLIDGTFPDYERVIPNKALVECAFKFKRDELLTAISQVGVLASDAGRAVKLHNNNGRVSLECKHPDFGSSTAATSTAWENSKSQSFGLNIKYLRQIASMCASAFDMHMIDAGSPFLVTDEDEDMTRVVMPMRV